MDIKKTIKNLESNNMKAYFLEGKDEVIPLLKTLIKKDDTVGVGGSETLSQLGIIEYLRENSNFLDRYKPNISKEERHELFRKGFFADVLVSSSNAVTENGELYNVDGTGNRVASLVYGPKSVIIVVGKNKITKDIDEAIKRVKTIASPKNCLRLERDTYCKNAGECAFKDGTIGSGCKSEGRICSSFLVSSYQMTKDRIKVIIVNEDLGY